MTWKPNLAHKLRHKVGLEEKIQTADGVGGTTTVWTQIATLWAEIRQLRGNESYVAGQLSASASHVFRVRYRSDITTTMRLTYDGRIFNIRSLNNVLKKNHLLEVLADEGVAP